MVGFSYMYIPLDGLSWLSFFFFPVCLQHPSTCFKFSAFSHFPPNPAGLPHLNHATRLAGIEPHSLLPPKIKQKILRRNERPLAPQHRLPRPPPASATNKPPPPLFFFWSAALSIGRCRHTHGRAGCHDITGCSLAVESDSKVGVFQISLRLTFLLWNGLVGQAGPADPAFACAWRSRRSRLSRLRTLSLWNTLSGLAGCSVWLQLIVGRVTSRNWHGNNNTCNIA